MIHTSAVEYPASGRVFPGTLASNPSHSSPRPGVLIFHGGAGVGQHERDRARRLAELGYVVFAPDLFGEKFENRAHGRAVIGGLVERPEVLRERVNAAVRWLRTTPSVDASRIAAVGFCFGGLAALELARSGADVSAVVSLHGGLTARAVARRHEIASKVLVCTGAADPFVTREHRASFEDEMTGADADWEMIVHGGALHSFTEASVDPAKSPGCAYHEGADRRSWRAMRGLFDEVFGSTTD